MLKDLIVSSFFKLTDDVPLFHVDQMLVYNTGLIPSRFYEALLDRNKLDFLSILISSSPLILGVAVVSR